MKKAHYHFDSELSWDTGVADGGPANPTKYVDFKGFFEHRQWDSTKSLDPMSGHPHCSLGEIAQFFWRGER
ncbi:hypothetical protein [Rhodoferax sp.]|uniref:hypothetical protein n=1 Tax=Rhodoferax sp. TaxID=50421 RepID=UPI002715FDB0|nr:hypothetical protein [Rhodoferax sp.]MDO9144090.1 hypothetical protein [Rhodoferax sp.]MDP2442478.1 hypothetical protein [Rhodoferax sp.]MDZ4209168.1 hypothetical protein [Rhodoferax sp.]